MRWLILAFGIAGCGSEVSGDWFRCGPTCDEHVGDGLRLRDDDTFTMLEADGSTLETDELYCEVTTDSGNGSYSYAETVLTTTTLAGRTTSVAFEMDGDAARVSAEAGEALWSRVEDRSSGPCPRFQRR